MVTCLDWSSCWAVLGTCHGAVTDIWSESPRYAVTESTFPWGLLGISLGAQGRLQKSEEGWEVGRKVRGQIETEERDKK